MSESVPSVLPG